MPEIAQPNGDPVEMNGLVCMWEDFTNSWAIVQEFEPSNTIDWLPKEIGKSAASAAAAEFYRRVRSGMYRDYES